jgi:hypothetical protein
VVVVVVMAAAVVVKVAVVVAVVTVVVIYMLHRHGIRCGESIAIVDGECNDYHNQHHNQHRISTMHSTSTTKAINTDWIAISKTSRRHSATGSGETRAPWQACP